MPLRNLIKEHLVHCSPRHSIREVAELMEREGVGAVLVAENRKPQGIITDRDLVLRCIKDGKDCRETLAEEAMSRTVITANLNDGIHHVIDLMKSNHVRRLPVVNEKGEAVGLISFGDLFGLLAQEFSDLSRAVAPTKLKLYQAAA